MRLYIKMRRVFCRLITFFVFHHFGVDAEDMSYINGCVHVKGAKHRITIGKGTIINSEPYCIPIGFPARASFWVLGEGHIAVGEHCGLSNTSLCSMNSIQIGNHVMLGGGVRIYDTDFHSLDYKKRRDLEHDDDRKSAPVVIEDDVFVGGGSIILKGTRIGTRSVIGASSVVSGTIPPDEIWAGNPARFIRKANRDEDSLDNQC